MAVDSRLSAKVHKLLRRLRRQEDHTKELAEALAEVAEAATILIALHFGDPGDGDTEAARLAEARDRANDLLAKLEIG